MSRRGSRVAGRLLVSLLAWAVIGPPGAAPAAGEPGVERRAVAEALAVGGRALEAGDLDAAAEAFADARRLDQGAFAPWLGLAEVAERRGELLAALELARGAAERAPDRPRILKVIARLQVRLGAPREALATLDRLRALAPSDPAGYLTAAAILRDVERPAEAIELLRAAPDGTPEVPFQLGLLLIETGDADGAVERAAAALERWPGDAGLELVMGLGLLARGERAAAAPRLERALDGGAPGEGRLQLALGEAKAGDGCSEPAVGHFERAVERLPALPEAHYKLALALRACGRAADAKAALDRFAELSRAADGADHRRRQTGAALNEVQQLASAGQLDEALARLDALAATSPADDRVEILRAKLLYSAGRAEQALASVRRAQALRPSRVEAHYLEGLFLSQTGRLDAAASALGRALGLDPDRFDALKLLAAVRAEQGRLEDAAGLFERAVAAGQDAVVHLAYARVLDALGRAEESAEQRAIYERLRDR